MYLPELCIRRPVLAVVVNLILLLLGLIAYDRLALREYPDVNEPIVSVTTRLRGASAEIVESQITARLEESLAGIEGIDFIRSSSRAEVSRISIKFRPVRDIDSAAADIRDRVARVRGRLPEDIDEPIIAKEEADAQPILWISFASAIDSPVQISDYVDRFVKTRLQVLPGISEVRIFGERRPAMRIWLDPLRLAAYGLTPADIEAALRAQNLELPAGSLESQAREFSVLADTALADPEAFARIVLKSQGGALLRLGDVAKVELGAYDERVRARLNGKPAVTLGIIKQSTANPLAVSRAVRGLLPAIEADLPTGMSLTLAYDSSAFIEASINNVYRALGEAILLVMLVVLVFLRSWRAALIPLAAIPLSLLGAIGLMVLFGFSLNTLTMLAFVLAIGLVVDDAIVVLENIHRHIADGLGPIAAALKGSREIGFAILAMTVTLAAVYTPVALQTGRTGKFFVEFALTLAGAVLVSGFVALTLSPMMCSRLLRPHPHPPSGWIADTGDRLRTLYRGILRRLIRRPFGIVLLLLLFGGLGFWLFSSLKSEVAPREDRNVILVSAQTAEGSAIAYTAGYAERLENFFAGLPGLQNLFVLTGAGNASSIFAPLRLVPREERDFSAQSLAAELRQKLARQPGLTVSINLPPPLGQSFSSKPVEFILLTSGDYADLVARAQALIARAREDGRLRDVDMDLRVARPEIRIGIDRDRAAELGIDPAAIAATLTTMLSGRDVTEFKRGSKQYDVVLRIAPEDRRLPDQAKDIYLRSPQGAMIPLADLIRLQESAAPLELNRWNQLRAVTITANLAPGISAGEGLAILTALAEETRGPDIAFDFGGQSRDLKEIGASGGIVFVLALVFIYLVLAAQFESFRDPLLIMTTVPLAMAGAFIAMRLTGGSLNVYSQVGLVTLIGLITKHGILIVEFANQRRAAGADIATAAIEAALLRVRPILMTTAAMTFGAVPLVLASGAGAEARQAIGWVIFGGLVFGSLFTLLIVPAIYALFARRVANSETTIPPASSPKVTASEIQESTLPKS